MGYSSVLVIMKKTKVVVTGGLGFIGSHIVDSLIDKSFRVYSIDIKPIYRAKYKNDKATYYKADIRNLESIKPIIKGAKYVFHTAAIPRVPYSILYPIKMHRTNALGTLNVLISSKEGGVKRVIYSASSSAYGDQKMTPLREDMHVNPKSPYGLQKYIGEQYGRVFNEVYGMGFVALRYFNVYGPRLDPDDAYALVIGKFLQQKKRGKALTITGNGRQTRDFTHVYDVVEANMKAALSTKVGNGEVINIGAGRNFSIYDLAKLVGGKIKYIPARVEPQDTLADNKKARRMLGWRPKIKLEEGIAELKKEFGIE